MLSDVANGYIYVKRNAPYSKGRYVNTYDGVDRPCGMGACKVLDDLLIARLIQPGMGTYRIQMQLTLDGKMLMAVAQ